MCEDTLGFLPYATEVWRSCKEPLKMACHAWGTWGRDLKAPTMLTENCKLYPAPVLLNRDKSTGSLPNISFWLFCKRHTLFTIQDVTNSRHTNLIWNLTTLVTLSRRTSLISLVYHSQRIVQQEEVTQLEQHWWWAKWNILLLKAAIVKCRKISKNLGFSQVFCFISVR